MVKVSVVRSLYFLFYLLYSTVAKGEAGAGVLVILDRKIEIF